MDSNLFSLSCSGRFIFGFTRLLKDRNGSREMMGIFWGGMGGFFARGARCLTRPCWRMG